MRNTVLATLLLVTLPRASLPTVTIVAPRAKLRLEVACTPAQQERGLMDRRTLPKHTGMLFAFAHERTRYFWMKDTLVPLDMLFIGADGRVTRVRSNVPTLSPQLADAKIPLEAGRARDVIELPAGEALWDGIIAGSHLGVRAGRRLCRKKSR